MSRRKSDSADAVSRKIAETKGAIDTMRAEHEARMRAHAETLEKMVATFEAIKDAPPPGKMPLQDDEAVGYMLADRVLEEYALTYLSAEQLGGLTAFRRLLTSLFGPPREMK